jgi:SpoVK/Ycf46/Vps4 family AAA+-type ATPase
MRPCAVPKIWLNGVYSVRGDSISVPLNYRPAIKSAYPWLPKPIDGYIDDYLNSSSSVIILIGKPGTGKTTFIKNLIHRSGGDAKVTYDEKVMSDDSLFAGFIESDARFMIMEDADSFLMAREDGNTMMYRFLNVSDGLISAEGKKLVFSTNLPAVHDIDAALMRPGRCFDVVEFRSLTRDEALKVAAETGVSLPDGSEFTLAEIFNVMPSGESTSVRRVGFL